MSGPCLWWARWALAPLAALDSGIANKTRCPVVKSLVVSARNEWAVFVMGSQGSRFFLALPNCDFAMILPLKGKLDEVLAYNFSGEWAGCSGKHVASSTEMPSSRIHFISRMSWKQDSTGCWQMFLLATCAGDIWWQRYKDTRNASGGRTDARTEMYFFSSVFSWNLQFFLWAKASFVSALSSSQLSATTGQAENCDDDEDDDDDDDDSFSI